MISVVEFLFLVLMIPHVQSTTLPNRYSPKRTSSSLTGTSVGGAGGLLLAIFLLACCLSYLLLSACFCIVYFAMQFLVFVMIFMLVGKVVLHGGEELPAKSHDPAKCT